MGKQPKRSRIEREQFWRGLIRRQQQSGQSIQEFCDSQGVSSPSFYSRRKRLNESNGRPTTQFVPVQVERELAAPAGTVAVGVRGAPRASPATFCPWRDSRPRSSSGNGCTS